MSDEIDKRMFEYDSLIGITPEVSRALYHQQLVYNKQLYEREQELKNELENVRNQHVALQEVIHEINFKYEQLLAIVNGIKEDTCGITEQLSRRTTKPSNGVYVTINGVNNGHPNNVTETVYEILPGQPPQLPPRVSAHPSNQRRGGDESNFPSQHQHHPARPSLENPTGDMLQVPQGDISTISSNSESNVSGNECVPQRRSQVLESDEESIPSPGVDSFGTSDFSSSDGATKPRGHGSCSQSCVTSPKTIVTSHQPEQEEFNRSLCVAQVQTDPYRRIKKKSRYFLGIRKPRKK